MDDAYTRMSLSWAGLSATRRKRATPFADGASSYESRVIRPEIRRRLSKRSRSPVYALTGAMGIYRQGCRGRRLNTQFQVRLLANICSEACWPANLTRELRAVRSQSPYRPDYLDAVQRVLPLHNSERIAVPVEEQLLPIDSPHPGAPMRPHRRALPLRYRTFVVAKGLDVASHASN